MNTIHEEEYRGYTIKIMPDDDCSMNPRTDIDNLGTLVCWHKRYDLGDENPFSDPQDAQEYFRENDCIVLSVYMYDHSGITINTSGFSCPSGRIGYIYVEKSKIRKEYKKKRVSPQLRKKIVKLLKGEVKEYDDYLRGDVYGYCIEKDGEQIDSCWGFFGDYDGYCMDEARRIIDYTIDEKRKKHIDQLKTWIKNRVPLQYRHQLAY